MEDNDKIVHSAVSIEGHTLGAHTDADDGETHAQDVDEDLEEELDEATRQFNFWTHQVHIFFVRKFLPAAENMIKLKQAVERRMATEEKSASKCESTAADMVQPSQVMIEEKTQA